MEKAPTPITTKVELTARLENIRIQSPAKFSLGDVTILSDYLWPHIKAALSEAEDSENKKLNRQIKDCIPPDDPSRKRLTIQDISIHNFDRWRERCGNYKLTWIDYIIQALKDAKR